MVKLTLNPPMKCPVVSVIDPLPNVSSCSAPPWFVRCGNPLAIQIITEVRLERTNGRGGYCRSLAVRSQWESLLRRRVDGGVMAADGSVLRVSAGELRRFAASLGPRAAGQSLDGEMCGSPWRWEGLGFHWSAMTSRASLFARWRRVFCVLCRKFCRFTKCFPSGLREQ